MERSEYEESLKVLRDLTNVIDTAVLRGYEKGIEEGREKGLEEGIEEGVEREKYAIAHKLKSLYLPLETIIQVTGLSIEEINSIE